MDKMKNIILITLSAFILLIINCNVSVADPVEDQFLLCDAWYSKDGTNWVNTTADDSLKIAEPFYLKITIQAKEDLEIMYYQVSSLGKDADFELIESPDNLADNVRVSDPIKDYSPPSNDTYVKINMPNPVEGETHTYIW